MSLSLNERTNLIKLTVAMFNVAPGATYLAEITGLYEANGRSLANVATILSNTPAYKTLNPVFQTAAEFATALLTPMGLQANREANEFVIAKFNAYGTGTVNKGQISLDTAAALVNYTGADASLLAAKATLDNKTTVATYYSVDKQIAGSDLAVLKAVLVGVTADVATVATAKAAVDGTATAGQTFTLTENIDLLPGTSGNDIFVAVNETGKVRLALGDDINGSAGTDTLKLVNALANVAAANLTSIEKVAITQSTVNAAAINAANWVGVQEVSSVASSQNIAVTNLQNLVTVGFDSTVTNVDVGFAAAAVAGTADNLNVTLNKAGNSSTTPTLTATAGIEALTIASNGAAKNYINASGVGAAVKTVTVAGDAALALTIDTTAVTSFDASANKGGVALTGTLAGTAAAGLSVKGSAAVDTLTINLANKADVDAGAGNDVVSLTNVAALTSTDSIIGGEGTDVLSLAVAGAKTVAVNTARSVITGFEILKVTDSFAAEVVGSAGPPVVVAVPAGSDGFDISKFGINSLQVAGDVLSATNVTGFTSGATVELQNAANQTFALNIGMKNATDAGTDSDTLNIKLNADVANATAGTADYYTTKLGVEGINILNVSTADNDVITKGGVEDGYTLELSLADNVTAINATGSSALNFVSSTATNALKTFDGSALTSNLTVDLSGFGGTQGVVIKGGAGVNTITGTSLADIITGGAAADVLVGGAGNDKIDGGAGNDKITGGLGADILTGGDGVDTFVFTATGNSIVTSFDTITDLKLGVGGDVLAFGAAAGTAGGIKALSSGAQASVTAAATLAAAVNQVLVETGDAAKTVAVFTYGTDTYVVYNAANADTASSFNATADTLVKITGVTGTLDASNFLTA